MEKSWSNWTSNHFLKHVRTKWELPCIVASFWVISYIIKQSSEVNKNWPQVFFQESGGFAFSVEEHMEEL